jgi:hypothetical protein
MTHPLSGYVAVEDSARLVRNYRYAVERMMRILGGWIALTPEISAKLLFGRHVWDNAQHADALGRRLPELRSTAGVSEPANAEVVAFIDAIEAAQAPGETAERLVGIYRVLKPHLRASYEEHLARANTVYEPPTRRILARCAEDERRHIAAGEVVLRHLATASGATERAQVWQGKLEVLLDRAGGVTGGGRPVNARGPDSPDPSLSDDPREFIRLERGGGTWKLPSDLEAAIAHVASGLIARDIEGVSRRSVDGVSLGEGVGPALEAVGAAAGFRVVAVAKVGGQRLVKLRFEGATGAITLITRWKLADDGWRAAAIDTVPLQPIPPV